MNNLIDLHTHSVLSRHAYSTVTENIEWAVSKGLKYYGISEHQYDDKGVGPHYYAFSNLRTIPHIYKGMHILKGVEYNILIDGSLDADKIKLNRVDYGIASIHSYVYEDQGIEINTQNYLKVLENERVNILGHIDNGAVPCDFEKVIQRTKELHKLIELNNSSLQPWSSRTNAHDNMLEIIDLCIKYNQPVIINSDAHICYDVGNYELVDNLLNEKNFPNELVLNYNESLIKEFFPNINYE